MIQNVCLFERFILDKNNSIDTLNRWPIFNSNDQWANEALELLTVNKLYPFYICFEYFQHPYSLAFKTKIIWYKTKIAFIDSS